MTRARAVSQPEQQGSGSGQGSFAFEGEASAGPASSVWQPICEGWRREEPGWWVMAGVGGICRESDGRWWFCPTNDGPRVGPWRTLSYAIQGVRAKVLNHMSNSESR